jgi:hypothetical protein
LPHNIVAKQNHILENMVGFMGKATLVIYPKNELGLGAHCTLHHTSRYHQWVISQKLYATHHGFQPRGYGIY